MAIWLTFGPAASAAGAEPSARWEDTLRRVADAVVALRVRTPRAFDTNSRSVGTATGFVVDAERGIILTNRHVVQPGPVTAVGIFHNQEEVELKPLYRDPVHDFGFFQYDPAALEFMKPHALPLSPGRARVGLEIRVVGNDAGERISILSGTLARLDRDAPDYGSRGYNDFNTFYYQAASGTSGGSSGSPVVDVDGHAVALNAGGRQRSATSYYLPLARVVPALERIRNGAPVARGTLQAIFRHQPYDELRRLGMRRATEAALRKAFAGGTGALVVAETVPGGPADGVLEPGDVLVRLAGRLVTGFEALESAFDARVGERIRLEVERGGDPLTFDLAVQDLHALSPRTYLEVSGGVLNELSYQQARNHAVPARGVYIAEPGYMLGRAGVPAGSLVTAVDGRPTPDLDTFEAVFSGLAGGVRVPLRWMPLRSPRTEQVTVVEVDRRWFPMQRCRRDDTSGLWPCSPSPPPPPPPEHVPVGLRFAADGERPLRRLAPSLVSVEFTSPVRIDGLHATRFQGAGLVVDAARGLVVVDRDTVPVTLGDLTVRFAGSVELPGHVVYVHPLHNFAVVGYDPSLLGSAGPRSAELRPRALGVGDAVWLVGLSQSERLLSRRTQVVRVQPLRLPLTGPPRFRDANLEAISIADTEATLGGVLADKKGRVLALWASFSTQEAGRPGSVLAGLPIEIVAEVVDGLREGRAPELRTLGVELTLLPLAEARSRGLPEDAAAQAPSASDGGDPRVLSVERVTAGTPAATRLREGDLLLAMDGKPVHTFRDVERAARAERVAVELVRDGHRELLEVPTHPLTGRGTERVLLWAGALLQRPHPALAVQRGILPDAVYVGAIYAGSPAQDYGLRALRRVVRVDGVATPDLDAFLRVVHAARNPFVRLQLLDLDGRVEVITLRPDPFYWPAVELVYGEEGWARVGPAGPEPPAGTAVDGGPRAAPDAASTRRTVGPQGDAP